MKPEEAIIAIELIREMKVNVPITQVDITNTEWAKEMAIEALEKQVAHDPQIETPTRTGTCLVKDRDGNYSDADWLDGRFWLKRHVSGPHEPVLIQSIVAWWYLPDAKVKKIDRGEEE